jgi:hypothetical protein
MEADVRRSRLERLCCSGRFHCLAGMAEKFWRGSVEAARFALKAASSRIKARNKGRRLMGYSQGK